MLQNSNFRCFLLLPCQSFSTCDELGWSDYPIIIPTCILQNGNGILSRIEGRSLGKKSKGYFKAQQTEIRPWRKYSGKPKKQAREQWALKRGRRKRRKREEGKTGEPNSIYFVAGICFLKYAPVTPIILPTQSHSSIHQIFNKTVTPPKVMQTRWKLHSTCPGKTDV